MKESKYNCGNIKSYELHKLYIVTMISQCSTETEVEGLYKKLYHKRVYYN